MSPARSESETPSDLRVAEGCPYRSVLVVTNPISGRGRGGKAAFELAEGLRRLGARTEVFATTARGDAFTKLRTLREEVDLVVSVGGDGTLREVLDGLVDPSVPVAMVPFGTANVLARELGLPRDVHHSLEILSRGHVLPVDVARVDGRLSLLMTGIGFDARAVREVERRRRGPITMAHYPIAVLRALRGYQPPRLTVSVDGQRLRDTYGFVLVSNSRNYAGFLCLSTEARMDDGRLEVYLFPTGKRMELAAAFVRGFVKSMAGGAVEVRRARHVEVSSEPPAPYQVDGDLAGETPLEIRVAPNQYRLVVP